MTRQNHILEPEDLMAYLDGELRPDRAVEAAAHLAGCKECQTLAHELQQISQAVLAWELEPATTRIDDEIEEIRNQETRTPRKLRAWRSPWRLSTLPHFKWAGAGVVVALVIAGLLLQNKPQPTAMKAGDAISTYITPYSSPSVAPNQAARSRLPGAGETGFVVDGTTDRTTVNGLLGNNGADKVSGTRTVRQESEASNSSVNTGPMIIRSADLVLVSNHFDAVRTNLNDIVARHGGYIAQLNASSPAGNGRSLTGTLRVPARQLDLTLADLKALGRLERETQNGQEITAEYVDLQARLTNAYNTERRLTDILNNRTGKLSDVLAVEQEIDRVRGEIEEMEAQKKGLKDQVDLASVSFSISEDYKSQLNVLPSSTSVRFRHALVAGYRAMIDSLLEVSLWLLSWLPALLVWCAVLFFPVRFAWRRLRTRSAQ